MRNLKILLGLLFTLIIICIYFFLVEPKDKIKLTPDMISKVRYLETNSVAEGTIKDYGQDAQNVFQKLISSKTVVSKTTFWKKKLFENSSNFSQRIIEFSLDNKENITFEILTFNVEGHKNESYIRHIGDSTIYHLNAEHTEDILIQFTNR
ncbi:hypothetical protein COL52_20335 [Bacillus toyonensis]|uniref:Uncharacterized protein n=2 Tax=Bacillus toyonensis TaxID=155322 RepID=A0A2B7VBN5_9BACI|nr:hypothetical protein [Bacillus toyonensis]PEL31196.1 hypothetical protein CN624_01470 [Bacillus toyonensis]PFY58312.1 hypothetical protein COL52_20335 [Bacillus toyonensis]PGG81790.1 hypothetical protein CON73_28605 [Bacillus toyonensis]